MSFFATQWDELQTFWRGSTFPYEVKRSAVAFGALALIGFGACMALPDLRDAIAAYIADLFGSMDLLDEAGNLSAMALFSNNLRACAVTMLYGLIPFVYLSALSLGINALLLGVLAAVSVSQGLSLAGYAAAILPHGLFEFPALVLAFAMGLFCCSQLTRRCRKDQTALSVFGCLTQISRLFLTVITPLLIAAALIETYLTPLVAGLFR